MWAAGGGLTEVEPATPSFGAAEQHWPVQLLASPQPGHENLS
jgi:hypothetical protein